MKLFIYSMLFFSLYVSCGQGYDTLIFVAADGSGEYESIQDAINSAKAFPDVSIQIHIKSGVYNEKVRVYAWNTNLSLIGDSTGPTIISYDDHFKKIDLGRNSTFHTYTLKVESSDFYAENLTIENTSGDVGQAVAVHVEGDRVAFQNCRFYGNQDTMYLGGEGTRQYFQNCTITGTTDFIFGSATAYFDACTIISKKASYITAASTPFNVDFGFVFKNCTLTGVGIPNGSTYLGRPWRSNARTVFISCEMGAHIHPAGWKEWHTGGETFFAEYASSGVGGDVSYRVDWSHQLSEAEADEYTLKRIFQNWKPVKF